MSLDQEHDRTTAENSMQIGLALARQKKFSDAKEHLQKSIGLLERLYGNHHQQVIDCLCVLGDVHFELGSYADAALTYNRLLIGWKNPPAQVAATAWLKLAKSYKQLKNIEEAEAAYQKGLAIADAGLPPQHPLTSALKAGLGVLRGSLDGPTGAHNKASTKAGSPKDAWASASSASSASLDEKRHGTRDGEDDEHGPPPELRSKLIPLSEATYPRMSVVDDVATQSETGLRQTQRQGVPTFTRLVALDPFEESSQIDSGPGSVQKEPIEQEKTLVEEDMPTLLVRTLPKKPAAEPASDDLYEDEQFQNQPSSNTEPPQVQTRSYGGQGREWAENTEKSFIAKVQINGGIKSRLVFGVPLRTILIILIVIVLFALIGVLFFCFMSS